MTMHVVEMNDHERRMVRIVEDPVEVAVLMRRDWQLRQNTCMVVEGPVDIDAQTIKGVPSADIYAKNQKAFAA